MAKILSIGLVLLALVAFLFSKNASESKAALVNDSDLIGIVDFKSTTELDSARKTETGYPYRVDGICEENLKGDVPKFLIAYSKAG